MLSHDELQELTKIPEELRNLQRWVTWKYEARDGKAPTKVLKNPITGDNASSTDPSTWVDFSTALTHIDKFDGIGCVIGPPYAAIDLDKCIDEPWALELIAQIGSYTELSPSGKGYHLWVRGRLPGKGRKCRRVEMYDGGRYFTVTGKSLNGRVIADYDLTTLYQQIESLDPIDAKAKPTKQLHDGSTLADTSGSKEPDAETLALLMAGDYEGLDLGDGSQSCADLELCTLLAMKHRDSPQIVERIDQDFRDSGLYRDWKWGRDDYRLHTIRLALENAETREAIAMTTEEVRVLGQEMGLQVAESTTLTKPAGTAQEEPALRERIRLPSPFYLLSQTAREMGEALKNGSVAQFVGNLPR